MATTPIEENMESGAEITNARNENELAQESEVAIASEVKQAADEEMNDADAVEDGEVEESDNGDEEESESDEEDTQPQVSLKDASGRPLSDFEVAARYAAIEIQSIASQFSATVVDTSRPATAPILPGATSHTNSTTMEQDNDEDSDDDAAPKPDSSASDSSEDNDEEEDGNDDENPHKLRAEIEAAMEREENKAAGPLKTPNEIAIVPIREPEVELTPDCPITRCGIILNVSRPGLMVTVKSDANAKPLDEGSVLCFEDRTVIGCVDEVFGPVLMPMYLVRFDKQEKIPAQTDLNKVVFFATQHTTYIIPENIRDKGTDASNIFDEETEETVYSDDEAEAAAKRANKKRNRTGDNVPASSVGHQSNTGSNTRNFTDYQSGGGHRGGRGGRGGGRGRGRGASHSSDYPHQPQHHHQGPVQTHSHGGFTRYTGHGMPPQGNGQYQYPPSGGRQQYGGPPQYAPPPYPPAPSMPMYGQPQYGGPPPYPPQAPPPYYGQPPHQQYAPPPMLPGQYPPQPGYYQQLDPHAYGHHAHNAPPPPPHGYGPPPPGRR